MTEVTDFDAARYNDAQHIVFTASGRGVLHQALRTSGIGGAVIYMPDFLGYGPIISTNDTSRWNWLKNEIGATSDWPEEYEEISGDTERFWNEASHPAKRIVWFSRRALGEYTGFLEWVWRRQNESYEVIDLTDIEVAHPNEPDKRRLLVSLAAVHPDSLEPKRLLNDAAPLTEQQRTDYLALWRDLRRENAPLRVLDAQGVHSAPIDFYDEMLISFVRAQWTRVIRVIGGALAESLEGDYFQINDAFIFARIRRLVQEGRLEARGGHPRYGFQEVRLPASQ